MSDLVYTYAQPSALMNSLAEEGLLLAAYAENTPASGAASFSRGQSRDTQLTAWGLTKLAKVAALRFVPQAGVLRDPIVTAGAERLRFEAFSSCNSVYARLDLGPAALDGKIGQSGTTNVNYNKLMVNVLSRIGRHEPVRLSVRQQEVTPEHAAGTVTERKVTLSESWLKGLAGAQAYLAQVEEKLQLNRL